MKLKNWLTIGSMAVILVFSSTLAYFSSSDTVTNRVDAASLGLRIIEEKYDEQPTHEALPGIAEVKDPCVKNTGDCPIYVFIAVTVPSADVRVLDSSIDNTDDIGRRKLTRLMEDKELFTWDYTANQMTTGYNQSQWTEMASLKDGHTYLFAYTGGDSSKMKELASGDKTEVVFNHVTLIENLYAWNERELEVLEYSKLKTDEKKAEWLTNHPYYTSESITALSSKENLESYGEYIVGTNQDIQVTAYAVQSRYIDVTSPDAVWEFLKKQ